MTFSSEQLNHFKFSAVVLDEFPVALRGVFTFMWDTLVASPPGVPNWDDSVTVLNLLHAKEGGVKKVPTLNKSFKEWDCTALFKATLFAQTFAVPDGTGGLSTLDKLYVRPRGLLAGTFHPSVISPTGNQAETFALALDQLRLLRNTLCHQSSTQNIDKATFDNYILLAKDAFTALGQNTTRIEEIGMMGEEDFPTARQRQLEDELNREKDAATKFKQIDDHLTKIESLVVEDVGSDVKDVKEEVTKIKELMAGIVDFKQGKQMEKLKVPLVRDSCIPDEIPHFVGRKRECQAILDHLTDEHTRLVDVWGPPGFGKTSVAINVAHHLQEMQIPVYFASLRGMESKDKLVSKLLSIFTEAAQAFCVSPSNWLIHCLQQLKNPFVLILDNADDLLETADVKLKEDVLRFIQEIAQCNHIKLLLTTRESLDYLSHKLPIRLEKVGVLDEATSVDLVKSLLSDYSTDADWRSIVEECGQVPLAMRLMCSIMREESVSFTDLSEELKVSSLVEVLDSDNFPNDARLKTIIKKSFERLTDHEKSALMSLAVFPSSFGIKEATAMLEDLEFKTELQVKKILRSLERKSLIDCSEDFRSFTIHSLFRSFIEERRNTDRETADVILTAQRHFYTYQISRFKEANEKFLSGHSYIAIFEVYRPEYTVLSLINGVRDEELYCKVVEVLSEVELFFFCTIGMSFPGLFQLIYNTALEEARKRQNLDDERELLAAKSVSHCFWKDYKTWDLPMQAGCTNPDHYPAKLVSYFGIYQLLCGNLEGGISSLKSSLNYLGNSCDKVVLKQLVYQLIAVSHWKRQEYKAASYVLYLYRKETERSSLYIADIFNVYEWVTRNQEDDCLLRFITFSFLTTWIHSDSDDNTLISLLALFSRVCSKVIESFSGAPLKRDFDEDFEACAQIYDTIISFYTALINGNLKGSIEAQLYISEHTVWPELFFGDRFDLVSLLTRIGFSYFMLNNETEAVKSFQSASEQRIRLGADDNWDSANTYLKIVQSQLGFGICKKAIGAHLNPYGIRGVTSDFTKAPLGAESYREGLSFVQQVLNARLKCFGEHVDTAHSFDSLGVICYTMRDLPSAVEAFKKASDMRSNLLGDHEDTARSYLSLGVVQYNTGDLSGAVESLQKASQIKNNTSGDLPGTTGSEKLLKCVYEDFIANELD